MEEKVCDALRSPRNVLSIRHGREKLPELLKLNEVSKNCKGVYRQIARSLMTHTLQHTTHRLLAGRMHSILEPELHKARYERSLQASLLLIQCTSCRRINTSQTLKVASTVLENRNRSAVGEGSHESRLTAFSDFTLKDWRMMTCLLY